MVSVIPKVFYPAQHKIMVGISLGIVLAVETNVTKRVPKGRFWIR